MVVAGATETRETRISTAFLTFPRRVAVLAARVRDVLISTTIGRIATVTVLTVSTTVTTVIVRPTTCHADSCIRVTQGGAGVRAIRGAVIEATGLRSRRRSSSRVRNHPFLAFFHLLVSGERGDDLVLALPLAASVAVADIVPKVVARVRDSVVSRQVNAYGQASINGVSISVDDSIRR